MNQPRVTLWDSGAKRARAFWREFGQFIPIGPDKPEERPAYALLLACARVIPPRHYPAIKARVEILLNGV